MGVLEARENAEKIGYPVVWENIKDADNVIDYNINEEITKDASGVINANNQTTTGMATVIPWINAPKLIASTSVTGIPEPDPEWSFYWTYVATWNTPTVTVVGWWASAYLSYTMTEGSNSLPYSWEIKNWWVEIPRWWGYSVTIRYFTMGQDEWRRYDHVYLNSTLVDSTSNIYSSTDHTITFNANKWDILWCETSIHSSFSDAYTKSAGVRFTITPK
jgi:hypothetical protein